jgi:hypothetical protein
MRIDIFKNTSDDFAPNFDNDTVQLSFIPIVDGSYRVAVWGNDDCGFERNFKSKKNAFKLFEELKSVDDITYQLLKRMGFRHA